jgi:hypothetical protein
MCENRGYMIDGLGYLGVKEPSSPNSEAGGTDEFIETILSDRNSINVFFLKIMKIYNDTTDKRAEPEQWIGHFGTGVSCS